MRTAKQIGKNKSFSIKREFMALERQEIVERQELRRVHRSSSDMLYYIALACHARRYREFYTAQDVDKYERLARIGEAHKSEFILWSSCD